MKEKKNRKDRRRCEIGKDEIRQQNWAAEIGHDGKRLLESRLWWTPTTLQEHGIEKK